MKGMTLRAMTQAVNGIYHGNGEDYDKEITAITIDSRKVTEGGLFIAIKGGLHEGVTDVWGVIVLGGFFFVCGLPGWALVRWVFNFIEQREGKSLLDIFREFKEEWKK